MTPEQWRDLDEAQRHWAVVVERAQGLGPLGGYFSGSRVTGLGRSDWTIRLLSDVHRERIVGNPAFRDELARLLQESGIDAGLAWETPGPVTEDELADYRGRSDAAARRAYLAEMPPSAYRKTPEWNAKRVRALIAAGYRCQVCNVSGVELNVHHRTYERQGREKPEDLIVLCRGCHKVFHRYRWLARPKQEPGGGRL